MFPSRSISKWKPGIGYYAWGRANYGFTEKLFGFVELAYFNQGDGEADGTEIKDSTVNWLELEIGGYYMTTENSWVAPVINYNLTGTNTASELGIGLYFGYFFLR